MKSVLSGIRIVEQGTFITGPCAGMMLADLGADVVKVESPDAAIRIARTRADSSRRTSRRTTATSAASRSICNAAADRARLRRSGRATPTSTSRTSVPARPSDSAPARQRLQELNPKLVYCSISGFGVERPVRRSPELRLRRAGAERLSQRRRRSGPSALSRSGARRRDHRHLRGVRRARRAVRAQPHRARAAGRSLDARSDGALRRRALRCVLRARSGAHVAAIGRGSRRRTSCARPTAD